jgi:hypothetical protein
MEVPPVATLRLTVRRDRLGRVMVDVPGPELTVTTVPPSGVHLALLLSDERAERLAASLRDVLGEGEVTRRP